jgi:hypothetical protein
MQQIVSTTASNKSAKMKQEYMQQGSRQATRQQVGSRTIHVLSQTGSRTAGSKSADRHQYRRAISRQTSSRTAGSKSADRHQYRRAISRQTSSRTAGSKSADRHQYRRVIGRQTSSRTARQ